MQLFVVQFKKKMCASKIRAELNLTVTTRRVKQILQNGATLTWQKRVAKPKLTINHKEARLSFARKFFSWKEEWRNVLFSDEKKFNLDGPDGWQCYWRDLRAEPEIFSKRNFGGGTLMVWGAFPYRGKVPLAWISTKMTSQDYIQLLEISLIEHGETLMRENFIFQQDNASIHCAKATKQWLRERNVEVLDWPACSPDLNPIENLWGIISRKVYENGKQFESIIALKNRIREVWVDLTLEVLKTLVDSMPDRIFDVVRNNGGVTKY